jgi:hypothetical protein
MDSRQGRKSPAFRLKGASLARAAAEVQRFVVAGTTAAMERDKIRLALFNAARMATL